MYHIVTIEREYASGGNEIGKKLAKELGFQFCDHSILVEAAKRLGIPSIYIEDLEETTTGSLIFNLSQTALGGIGKNTNNVPLASQLFLEEKKVIEEIVAKGNCVIVGRCASAILKDRKDCLNVFIHGGKEYRIKRAIEREHINPKEAEDILKKIDKQRSNFYHTHSNWIWGDKRYAHIILDSGVIGTDTCVQLLLQTVKS